MKNGIIGLMACMMIVGTAAVVAADGPPGRACGGFVDSGCYFCHNFTGEDWPYHAFSEGHCASDPANYGWYWCGLYIATQPGLSGDCWT